MGKKRDLGVDGGAVVQSGDIVHDGDKLIIVASGQTGYGLDGGLTLTGLAATGNADEYEVGDPTGNRLRPSVSFAVKPATTKLDAPTLSSTPVSNTGTSITLTAPAGSAQDLTSLLQFRCATSESGLTDAVWQYSREFTGLTSGTSYWFQARNKTNKTDIWADSDPSNAVQITAGAAPATYYSVMLESGSNYTCEVLVNGVSKASGLTPGQSLNSAAASGDTVKIIPAPASGYGIFSVSANHVSQMTSTALPLADGGYSFTMPARHVYVAVNTATVKTVTVDPYEHGTVTTSADDKITAGTFVGGVLTVTAAPDEGYYLASLAYSTDDGETWTSIVTSANGGIIGDVSAPVTRIKAEFAASDHSLSITDEAELRAFATAVNAGDGHLGATVTLANDIVLTAEWVPIGTVENPFKGVFDGGGHIVSGVDINYTQEDFDAATENRNLKYDYIGFFGYASDAEIGNLTIEGKIVDAGSAARSNGATYVGGILGFGAATTIKNCVNKTDITSNVSVCLGGIAGMATAINCLNYGTLETVLYNSNTGGIVGEGNCAGCGNYGSITIACEINISTPAAGGVYYNEQAHGHAGGVAGQTYGTITNSFNKGAGCRSRHGRNGRTRLRRH